MPFLALMVLGIGVGLGYNGTHLGARVPAVLCSEAESVQTS